MADESSTPPVSSLRSRFEKLAIGKGHPSTSHTVTGTGGRRVFSHDQAMSPSTPSIIETMVSGSSRSMYLPPGILPRVRSHSNPAAVDPELLVNTESVEDESGAGSRVGSRRASILRASPSSPDLAASSPRSMTPTPAAEASTLLQAPTEAPPGPSMRCSPPPPPLAPKIKPRPPSTHSLPTASAIPNPTRSTLMANASSRPNSPAFESGQKRPPPPLPRRRASDQSSDGDSVEEGKQDYSVLGVSSLRARFTGSSSSSLSETQHPPPPPPPRRIFSPSRSPSPAPNATFAPRSTGSSPVPPPLPARNSLILDSTTTIDMIATTLTAAASDPPHYSPSKPGSYPTSPPPLPSRSSTSTRTNTDPDDWDYQDDNQDQPSSVSRSSSDSRTSLLERTPQQSSVHHLPPPLHSSSGSSLGRIPAAQSSPVKIPPRPPPVIPPRPVRREASDGAPSSPTSSGMPPPPHPSRKHAASTSMINSTVEEILGPPPLPSRPRSGLFDASHETHSAPGSLISPPPPPPRPKGLPTTAKTKIVATTTILSGSRYESPVTETPPIGIFAIPPPPTRTVGLGVIPPRAPSTVTCESTSSDDESADSPGSLHTPGPSGSFATHKRYGDELPDSSSSSRNPPFMIPPFTVSTPAHVGVVAVAGNWVCVGSHSVKVYNMLLSSEDPEFCIELKDMNFEWRAKEPRVTAMAFRPGSQPEDEGRYLWCGTKDGYLWELDVWNGKVTDSRPTAHSNPVTHIIRHSKSMITIDESGKLLIFKEPEGGQIGRPILSGPAPRTQRTTEKQGFAAVFREMIWTSAGTSGSSSGAATNGMTGTKSSGPMIRLYDFSTSAFSTRTVRPPEAVGAVTAATVIPSRPNLVYVGHESGHVTIWDLDGSNGAESSHSPLPVCTNTIKVGASDVLSLEGVRDKLWAGSRKGAISVYDVETTPWRVTNVWPAHGEYPVLKLAVDPLALERGKRLTVFSVGRDEKVRFWDGFLAVDWIESELRKREAAFSTFRKLKILVCTWNVDAAKPEALAGTPENVSFLNTFLESVDAPDVIVFGFQELIDLESKQLTAKTVLLGNPKRKADGSISEKVSRHYRLWYDRLVLAVRLAMPPDCPYTVVHTENLVGLFTCIFVRNSERICLRDTAITTVKRGMGGRYGNKGAIVTRFVVDDTSICFINCHLAAGQSQKMARNQDLAAILEEKSVFSPTDQDVPVAYVGGGDGSMILDHEICFLNGDLNYRIDLRREAIIASVESGDLEHLLNHDQLLKEVKFNPGFRLRAFKESRITFAPTYKYDRNSSTYDSSSKKRSPAWCDRILYRCRDPTKVQSLHYQRYEANVSDHRPVSGAFQVTVKSVRPDARATVKETVEQEWKQRQTVLLEDALRFYTIQLGL